MKKNCLSFLVSICLLFNLQTFYAQVNTWTPIASPAPDSSGSLMLLLSDGSVLCKTNYGTGDRVGNQWNKLTPNNQGSYINGTWSKVCPMKNTRLYFSSQTLKNGKVYIAGGEYGNGTNFGEIYDPVTNSWLQLPNINAVISDACSALLPDGKILQASLSTPNKTLLFDPSTNTYSNGPNTLGGHNESTWLRLADNSILFADNNGTSSERYIPSLNQWIVDSQVPTNLYDPYGTETGPGFLLPDGRAFFIGSRGNTAFYTPSGNTSPGTWSVGPTVPNNHGMPDAPGSMMVDGKIIFAAGPKPFATGVANIFIAPTYFYEFDYLSGTYTQINAPGGGLTVADTAFNTNMLTLPDGNVMYSQYFKKTYYVHKPIGAPLAVAKPTITSVAQNGCSNTFTLTGLLFNGICEGTCYGDDWQMNTNFPIVRLTSGSNVYYARTYNWNHNGVRNFTQTDTTLFELPPGLPNSNYSLSVIANGVASNPITFTFAAFPSLISPLTAPIICSGANFSYNAVVSPSTSTLFWTRNAVSGISNPAITTPQNTNPNETLINTTNISKTAVYAYTVSNGSCTTNYQVNVVVHPPGAITITSVPNVCSNTPVIIKAKGVATYTWNNGVQSSSITVTPTVTSIYSVSGNDYNGCLIINQTTLTVFPLPTISIICPTLVCNSQTITINANSNGASYLWSTGGNSSVIIVAPTNNTLYIVTATSANNCKQKDSVSVKVQDCTFIDEINSTQNGICIYPNPFSKELNFEFIQNTESACLLKIHDIAGRLVKEIAVKTECNKHQIINLSDLEKGTYYLLIESNNKVFRKIILKE